ncbi:hypothetical protein T552_02560 [Pneumocystis carinii B80]|uniref:Vesicle tethering protein Uso1/P115-like head domain-containing protein n=1 Tax=Pneumocystis carinii (strain B80) TaxID=1408658 RepID=A0A0W4ZFC1_PNEC8|nr:hypothetical protein T552_02560 [Pneumocystis carinii B80]KTW27068.1 hypothetical protein T552_02560 [Pneumocystis carinii B80]
MDFLFKGYNFLPQPKQQIAEETIIKLCDKLEHATLLEDRRAAVLGLKGFSREYPEAVIAGSLKGLIQSLRKDQQDSDILKVTLETIVILFESHDSSCNNDTSLWLADEFVLKNENFEILLDILKDTEFYVRLYSVKIILFIVKYRLIEVQECMFLSHDGISRIVALLDDKRDAIRNEAILLLTSISNDNIELQKRAVFENVFDRILTIIHNEGGLLYGNLIVFDCLVLLQNLVRYNYSNQNWFREMGFFSKIKELLDEVFNADEIKMLQEKQKLVNISTVLEFIRLFVPKETLGNTLNQNAILKEGVFVRIIELSFLFDVPFALQAEAVKTCGYLIKGNIDSQKFFSKSFLSLNNMQFSPKSEYIIIQHLFSIALFSLKSNFSLRLACCHFLQSYICCNSSKQIDILVYIIDMFKKNDFSESYLCNPLTIILVFNQGKKSGCEIWFSCVMLMHIIEENLEAKKLIREIVIGDPSLGEEPVSCIHVISANLVSSLGYSFEYRASVAYFMLLIFWLFDDNESVSEFLNEGSTVQYLISVLQNSKIGIILQGLAAVLLAIVYHFTDELSAIPRELLKRLIDRIGRDSFVNRIIQFKEHPQLRDCMLLDYKENIDDIYFEDTFITFFRDNYGIIRKSIDKDPHLSLQTKKISIENEELTKNNAFLANELERKELKLQLLQEEKENYIREHNTKVENLVMELEVGKQNINDMEKQFIQKGSDFESSLKKFQEEINNLLLEKKDLSLSLEDAKKELANIVELKKKEAEDFAVIVNDLEKDLTYYRELSYEVSDLRSLRDSLQLQLSQEKMSLESFKNDFSQLKKQEHKLMNEILELKDQKNELEKKLKEIDESWLLVVEELEKKRKRDKCRLKELGDIVSETDNESENDQ